MNGHSNKNLIYDILVKLLGIKLGTLSLCACVSVTDITEFKDGYKTALNLGIFCTKLERCNPY
jgi:hypothetical protein